MYDANRKKKEIARVVLCHGNKRETKTKPVINTSRQIVSAIGCQFGLDVHLGRSHLEHSLKVLLGFRDVLEVVDIVGLGHAAKHISDHLVVVHPLFDKRLDRGLLWLWGGHRLD